MSGVSGAQGQRGVRARREAGIDPICHTLAGAGLARSGLGGRTALGTTTLVIGANIPDVDVLAYLWGPAADLAFRRGWTHGILALALWPLVLTGAIVLLDRAIRRLRRIERPTSLMTRQVLLLAAIAVWSHPVLDTLNTYGVRWLMPFSGRWFYGDTLFIVDPWLWLTLAIGVILSRSSRRPARLALGVAAAYGLAMALSSLAARRIAARELVEATGEPVRRLMVSPLPVNPFERRVVVDQGEVYRSASFRWLTSPHTDIASIDVYPKGEVSHPAARAAAATTLGRRFLGWARFPASEIEDRGAGHYLVHIVDLRYADRPGVRFGVVSIPVTSGVSSTSPRIESARPRRSRR